MRKRSEKGMGFIIFIIVLCLFLIFILKEPSYLTKNTGILEGNGLERNGGLSDYNGQNESLANVLDNDISLTDSLGASETQLQEEVEDNLTFLINNLSYERSGSETMVAVVGGLLIVYLIIIGPVTYFYLKRVGKMERMWLIFPAVSLLFGCIILFMSNDYIIREPHVDILKVVTPGEYSVCYGAATSPGDDSFSLFFDDLAGSLQPWISSDDYVIDDMERSFTLYPEYVFEKDYFQFKIRETEKGQFIHNILMEGQTGAGELYNSTDYNFSHIMLCYEDNFCVIAGMNAGERYQITAEEWKKDERGMVGSLKEELQLYAGLSNDEEKIFNFAWYLHVNSDPGQLHITAITKEGDMGIVESGVNLISYSLFYQ